MDPELVKQKKEINVGSRNSQLALIQTNSVIDQLEKFYSNNPQQLQAFHSKYQLSIKFNIISMTTKGDNVIDTALPLIGSKSLFTRELEDALLKGEVDFVVHSLKDLPTSLPEGCVIGAVLKRDSPEDVIVLKESLRSKLDPVDLLLGRGAGIESGKFKIGTSSMRRVAMVKRLNPHLECINIRGNLNTRFAKLDNEAYEYSAIILAMAGLDRMGWSERGSSLLTPQKIKYLTDWCYAVGQGAIAVECRTGDHRILDLLSPLVDNQTMLEVIAERSLMRKLEGGCSVPLGVRSNWTKQGAGMVLSLESIVLSVDGKIAVKECGQMELSTDETCVAENLGFESLTTGITLCAAELSRPYIKRNMVECSRFGAKIAKKMIKKGCMDILRQRHQ